MNAKAEVVVAGGIIQMRSGPTVADLIEALQKVTDPSAPISIQTAGGIIDTPCFIYHDRDFGLIII